MDDVSNDKKILFVRGFNTYMGGTCDTESDTKDLYWTIKLYLETKFPEYEFTYFDYAPDTDLIHLIDCLKCKIERYKPTHLIGHSFGGTLIADWLKNAYDECDDKPTHAILLMPFLPTNDAALSIVKSLYEVIPSIIEVLLKHVILLPGPIVFNPTALFDILSFMRLDWSFVPFFQVLQGYNHVTDKLLNKCTSNSAAKNLSISAIIATNDNITATTTRQSLIDICNSKLHQYKRINGTHLEFRSSRNNSQFFDVFGNLF